MKYLLNLQILKIILVIILSIANKYNYAQKEPAKFKTEQDYDNFDIQSASFLLPQAHTKWHYYHSFSFSYVNLPPEWTRENINAPMLTYIGKFSLPYGFDMQASMATIIVSNRLSLGAFWNYSIHNYHFGIGYQMVYDFGQLNKFGYRSKFKGWEQQPSITAGYSFKKIAVILRGDLYRTNSFDFVEGGDSVPIWNSFLNGYSISASIEQRLYRNKIFSVGIKVNEIRYHFLAWPAFPVNQSRYFVPELQLGIKL